MVGDFPSQHIGGGHGERGTLTGQRCRAESSITYQRNPSARPGVHLDLTDIVEVELGATIESGQDVRTFPSGGMKLGLENCLLGFQII